MTFLGPKGSHYEGSAHPCPINPGYGPGVDSTFDTVSDKSGASILLRYTTASAASCMKHTMPMILHESQQNLTTNTVKS